MSNSRAAQFDNLTKRQKRVCVEVCAYSTPRSPDAQRRTTRELAPRIKRSRRHKTLAGQQIAVSELGAVSHLKNYGISIDPPLLLQLLLRVGNGDLDSQALAGMCPRRR
jgi:hypothetical protein